jgi:hypothetical protein
VARTKKSEHKTSATETWFAILFTIILGIQSVREFVAAFSEHGDLRIRSFAMAAFYGLISYGIWRTFRSRNSN